MAKNTSCGVQLRIRGKVQGVGFRPFVWQLAQQLNLRGDVCNDGDGVEVRLLEDPETFLVQLHQHCPPLARIDSVEREPFIWSQLPTEFTIRQSAGGAMNTQIVPGCRHLPCLPCRNEYPRRTALSLSIYQLYPLRPALHHYSRHALRSPVYRDGGVSAVSSL